MISTTHPSWHLILQTALHKLDPKYLEYLQTDTSYFPNKANFLNAFSLPLQDTKYILFGQDPYPRIQSATGYAFIDGAVSDIWSSTGLSREVNRATSLRNFIKMLLVADTKLGRCDVSQEAISQLDKSDMIDKIQELKDNMLSSGILLLNTSLVYSGKNDQKHHIRHFRPFICSILNSLGGTKLENSGWMKSKVSINQIFDTPKLILFGSIAKEIQRLNIENFKTYEFIHPYNIGFINDKMVHLLFKNMKLLQRL